jgi:hypothetical protein
MTLQEQKSLVEGEAQAFKRAVAKDKKEYNDASDLYEKAKAKVDGFLSGTRSAIQADSVMAKAEYQKSVDDAVAASRAFMDFSRKTRGVGKGLPLADIGLFIINIGKAAWEVKTKNDDALRQRILADLETYRWVHFETV